ncbi:MAG: hypothetical protein LBQ46_12255 [Treponema sp.]|jgi:hypothetical protein|nr:hypothetical protein [Treponema sp.]
MREIWIPEFLSSLFVLIFLVRPLFKGLWPLDGIAWFPVLALGVACALFPAYGYRPECVPLLANQGFMALMNLGPLLKGSRHIAGFRQRGPLFTVSALVFLVLVTGMALWFAPPDLPPAGARLVVQVRGRNGAFGGYKLHVFGGEGRESPPAADSPAGPSSARPVIFLVPPDFGGLDAVDGVCSALGDRGFTVISYTRPGFLSPLDLAGLWSAFRKGTVLKKANDFGRALEEGRRRELTFLLPYVKENLAALAPAADGDLLFLAGWGAGGAALVSLVPESSGPGYPGIWGPAAARRTGLPARSPLPYGVRGLVAVESRLWTAWDPAPAPERSAGPRILESLRNWAARLRPERIGGLGTVPRPACPVLYLVSDRALGGGEGSYAALFSALRNSGGPAALAAMEGAGPLDYTDFPAERSLYSALFPGRSRGSGRGVFPGSEALSSSRYTAALIARFCQLTVPGRIPAGDSEAGTRFQGRPVLELETRYWNFGDLDLY